MNMVHLANALLKDMKPATYEDICCYCGEAGANKIPAPVQWPEQEAPTSEYVHSECENREEARASALCQGKERDDYLDRLIGA